MERDPATTADATRAWWWRVLLGVSVALWVLLAGPPTVETDSGAEYAGAFVGGLLITLAIASVLRFVYVRFVRRGRPLLSPWLFVIAAFVGLLGKLGNLAEENEERATAAGPAYVSVYSGPEPPSAGVSRPPFAVIAPH